MTSVAFAFPPSADFCDQNVRTSPRAPDRQFSSKVKYADAHGTGTMSGVRVLSRWYGTMRTDPAPFFSADSLRVSFVELLNLNVNTRLPESSWRPLSEARRHTTATR